MRKFPTFDFERTMMAKGYRVIAGVDEAGAGALAGPLVAAAVVLSNDSDLNDLDDSKRLSAKKREELFDQICERASAFAIASVSVQEIETLGLRPANYLAMRRALRGIHGLDFALVDAWTIPDLSVEQSGIVRGDQLVKSIAAASILAKVHRDRLMRTLAQNYPRYDFDRHKGYGTLAHREAIAKHGPCEIHRLSYKTFHSIS
jgi:ribonuclease HII